MLTSSGHSLKLGYWNKGQSKYIQCENFCVFWDTVGKKNQNKMHEGVLLFLNLGGWQEGWNEHAYVEFDDNNLKNRHLQFMISSCLGAAWQRWTQWASWASRSKGKWHHRHWDKAAHLGRSLGWASKGSRENTAGHCKQSSWKSTDSGQVKACI